MRLPVKLITDSFVQLTFFSQLPVIYRLAEKMNETSAGVPNSHQKNYLVLRKNMKEFINLSTRIHN